MKSKKYYIYIMTNKYRKVLYIGVTGDLEQRVWQHKTHQIRKSFTDKYNCEYCVYYEEFDYINDAIDREKELKKWSRKKKEDLINTVNPEWRELINEKGFIRNKI
ncbi:MAG: GIY-YIG nuclease family protein [Bacteroidales bacterium]|nr:GIY-YIG nuclease family protein [Bacteroidales bacterium]